jgi:hypothetical protein
VDTKASFLDVALEHKGLCAARSHNRAAAAAGSGAGGKGEAAATSSKGARAVAVPLAPASSAAPSSSSQQQQAPVPRSKKAPLSRELAKLVTDLVGIPGSPTIQQDARHRRKQQGGGSGSQQQQDQQQQQRHGPSSSAEDTMDGLSDTDMEEGAAAAPAPAGGSRKERPGKRPLQAAAGDPQQPLSSKPAAAGGEGGPAGGLVKQETSSCGSEQDRVLAEHLQLVAPGSPKQEAKPGTEVWWLGGQLPVGCLGVLMQVARELASMAVLLARIAMLLAVGWAVGCIHLCAAAQHSLYPA